MADEFKNAEGQDITGTDDMPVSTDKALSDVLAIVGMGGSKPATEKVAAEVLIDNTTAGGGTANLEVTAENEKPVEPIKPIEPTIVKAKETPVPPKPVDILEILGIKKPEPVQETVIDTPNTTELPLQEWQKEKMALLAELEETKKASVYFEEYMKDPYAFRAKYEPQLFKQFDKVGFVNSKLNEKYGVELGPDANEALIVGTRSFDYTQDRDSLLRQAESYNGLASQTEQKDSQQIETEANAVLDTVREKYSIDSTLFDTEIRNKIKTATGQEVAEMIAEGFLAKQKLTQITEALKQQMDRGNIPASITNLSSSVQPIVDKDLKMLEVLMPGRFKQAFGNKGT